MMSDQIEIQFQYYYVYVNMLHVVMTAQTGEYILIHFYNKLLYKYTRSVGNS